MPTNNANIGITYIDANTPPLTPSDDEIYFCKQSESIWVGDTQHSIGPLEHDITTYSFDDGIDSYFKKVVSSIVPVQAGSGTPSTTNVRAISGFTECTVLDRGINQWDEEWELGLYTVDGEKSSSNSNLRTKNKIKVLPNTSYYFYYGSGGNNLARFVYYYDANNNFISRLGMTTVNTFKTPDNAYYITFYLGASYGVTYNNDISINYPATDTDYHTYKATTATISFGSAGTVYGGEVDLTTGVLTVTYGYVDLGSLNWNYTPSSQQFYISYNTITNTPKIPPTNVKANAICSNYEVVARDNATNLSFCIATNGNFVIYDSNYTNATTFKNAMSGVQLVYELATPQTYQLTPAQLRSLVGTNNLTSSTGEVTEVEYIRNETISWVIDQIQDNSIEWTVIP